jgi:hypothetical protein
MPTDMVHCHISENRERRDEELLEAVVGRAVRHASVALDAAEPSRGPAVEALDRVIAAGWSELVRHSTIADAAAEQLSPAALTRRPPSGSAANPRPHRARSPRGGLPHRRSD